MLFTLTTSHKHLLPIYKAKRLLPALSPTHGPQFVQLWDLTVSGNKPLGLFQTGSHVVQAGLKLE